MIKRVFLIVLDSLGIGEMPDANSFGDRGANTLKRISHSPEFKVDNLIRLGLGNIDGIDYLNRAESPLAAVGRMTEKSAGKDTTIGHWEIAGLVSEKAMPTYPNGFPDEVIDEFSRLTGRGVLCNSTYSGTDVIRDYGLEHIETGKLIVYTSADSVFQIAAHEDVVPPEKLYEYCRIARKNLCGEHAVGRVIARPFSGEYPDFKRTSRRHDFSLLPPKETLLDAIKSAGKSVIAIGKITDIFAGQGITESIFTTSNSDGMEKTMATLDRDFDGLCFTNLVDFDMVYGHRQDIDGYASALSGFDKWLGDFTAKMKESDLLIITADHGCDPGDKSTDHTREYTPLVVYGNRVKPTNLGTRGSFADIAAFIKDALLVDFDGDGDSFADQILR
ncbi:MAG: phosphopentomutase [Clostridia bacterium]|nr:phosphopentomutase [Clostridia bacterium]MBQ9958294.1 phosphopentomutase [Clostridia bacterium]